ncbi:MAG: protein kinase [Chthoniobacterales bacterium]
MERKTFLNRYRVCLEKNGTPAELRNEPGKLVYKAEDTVAGQEVALEVVSSTSLRVSVLEKLEAEVRAAQQINHINIPKLIDFGSEEGQLIYVTEYVDGTTAEAWVGEHGPMPIGAVLRIAMQVVGALGAATFHGIFHHAITPREIMLVPGQTAEGDWPLIKVLNFVGVAPSASRGDGFANPSMNALDFASPEQVQSGTVDFRSELFSLGCTLWFLLTGAPPVAGAATVRSASRVPAAVKHLITQMLAIDPTERPLDPLALQRQIQSCLAQVERRDAVAKKFALPLASAKTRAKSSARPRVALKALALAALLLSMAALAAVVLPERLRPGRLFAGEDEPIGVPVGVPETPTAPAVAGTNSAPANTASGSDVASQSPVLASTAEAPSSDEDNTSSSDAEASSQRAPSQVTQLAENNVAAGSSAIEPRPPPSPAAETSEPAPSVTDTAPVIAQANEPEPPAEGPTQTAAPSPPAKEEANSHAQASATADDLVAKPETSPPAASPKIAQRQTDDSPPEAAKPQRRRPGAPVKGSKRQRNKERLAAADKMPPVPRGSVRAEYLGTTPEGELIFGLPSEEEGFVTPRESSRGESSRRSRRRTVKDPEELPVLPALPPVLPALPPDEE